MAALNEVLRNLVLAMQLDENAVRERLKIARKKSGFTQEDVADLLHISKGTVENDEGRKQDSPKIWERLNDYARIYNTPVECLIWGDAAVVHDKTIADDLSFVLTRLERITDHFEALIAAREDGQPVSLDDQPTRSRV